MTQKGDTVRLCGHIKQKRCGGQSLGKKELVATPLYKLVVFESYAGMFDTRPLASNGTRRCLLAHHAFSLCFFFHEGNSLMTARVSERPQERGAIPE